MARRPIKSTSHLLNNFINRHHKTVFKDLAGAIIVVDTKGNIKYVNQYATKFTGYKCAELKHKKITDIVTKDSQKTVRQTFNRLIQGKTIKPYELSFFNKQGKVHYGQASAKAIKHNGKVIGVFGFVTDISAHKKDIKELSKIIKELTLLNNIGKELTSTVNIELLFSKILIYLSATLGYERIGILIYDEKNKKLIIRATTKPFGKFKQIKEIALNQGITGYVLRTGKTYLTNDVSKDKYYLVLDRKTRSEIAVPLIYNKQVIGVINVESYKKDAFDKADLRILSLIANQAAIAVKNSQLYESLEASYLDTIKALVSAMEAKDNYTHGHSERVRRYALQIAEALKLNKSQIRELNYAGYLHDIGKIGIKDTLLSKIEPLTEKEFNLIKKHPEIGSNILKDVKHLSSICTIIQSEHERYDGNGYPRGLEKSHIPIGARIIAVADAYDAMTTDRPYRKALSPNQAKRILRKEAGKQFDPIIVRVFLKILKKNNR